MTTSDFSRDRHFAPSAVVAATRIGWIMPSGKIASGSPVLVENNRTNPV